MQRPKALADAVDTHQYTIQAMAGKLPPTRYVFHPRLVESIRGVDALISEINARVKVGSTCG